jgi:hypothetical protein
MGSFSYMRISALYNRAKNVNAAWSLFDRAHQIINAVIVFGAAVIAWASTTWHSYWDTYSWAGVAFAFLVSCIGLSLAFFLVGLGVHLWRGVLSTSPSIAKPLPEATVPPAPAAIPAFDAALYVGSVWNVSADFTKIKDELSFAITIHISNQTDKNIAIESIRGNLIFERWTLPAVSPPGNMPVIAIAHQHDGSAFTIRQGVTKEQRDRICEVLESGEIVKFDFNLIRFLVRVDSAERTELISLDNLDNITCRYPKDGDIVCGRNVNFSARVTA